MAEVHVRAWRAAYRGILAAQLLDDLSVDLREKAWRSTLAGEDAPAFRRELGRRDPVDLHAQRRAFYARSGFRLDGTRGVHEASGVTTTRMRLALV